jgi:hypothetical protein
MIDLRRALRNFDDVAPDDVVFDRARRGPSRPLPSSGGHRGERIVAAVTAFAVFALAGTFAWRALRETGKVEMPQDPRVEVVPLGADGSTLWPQRTHAELVSAQSRTDAGKGGFRWQLDRDEVVNRFAETVLGWPRDTYRMTLDESEEAQGTAIAHLERSAETCPPRTADDEARGVSPCLPGAEDVSLVQPVRAREGGIWVVRDVRSSAATVDLEPGEIVTNAGSVAAHVEVAQDRHAAWATAIGGFDDDRNCFGFAGAAPPGGDFGIDVRIEPDRTAGTDCGTRVHGYVVVATAVFDLVCCGYVANPLNGDSSPFVSVTALPIVVAIPENEVEPGMNVYTDPLGWRVDVPEPWYVAPASDVPLNRTLTISTVALPAEGDTPTGPDASTFPTDSVVLVVTHTRGDPPPERASNDSSFPLDADALRNPFQTQEAPVLSFQGNGLAFRARLFVGELASDADIGAMKEVVRSLRFPSLQGGRQANGWLSLGDGDGSPVEVGSPSFAARFGLVYVVRGTGGTYVLDLAPDGCGQGEGEDHRWDRSRMQIWIRCPNGRDIRYERDGTPVAGNPAGHTDALTIHPAITAWDGSILVAVGATLTSVERYWPHA